MTLDVVVIRDAYKRGQRIHDIRYVVENASDLFSLARDIFVLKRETLSRLGIRSPYEGNSVSMLTAHSVLYR